MTKPLFSYYGGKQRIASKIIEYLPPHTVYTEPFAGGCAVLFAKGLSPEKSSNYYREAINDLDERIINLYRVARNNPDEFVRLINLTPYSQAEHKKAIEIGKDPNASAIDRAWAEYVNLKMSFANTRDAGWGTGVTSRNLCSTWINSVTCLPEVLERLKNVHIGCEDALTFIKRWDSPHTCHYVDPPYPGTEQGHYEGYSNKDFEDLCDLLNTVEGSFVLSNYFQPTADKYGWKRVDIKAYCSSSGKGKTNLKTRSRAANAGELDDRSRVECLWIVDRSANVRADLKSKLWTPSNHFQTHTLF
jgi:DNA adenine methylase